MVDISKICAPSDAWVRRHGGDTAAQAQLRACLIAALEGLSTTEQIRVGAEIVDVLRDELMAAAAQVRQRAAVEAREEEGLAPAEIARLSGLSSQTVSRLLVRGRQSRVENSLEAS